MVNADGQLFTIEGIAASLIILMAAYIVVNTTSVYTPGDTHITNMQLEVLGTDALKMMNTAYNGSAQKTPLQTIVEQNDNAGFRTTFQNLINNRTMNRQDSIQFQANMTYIINSGPEKGTINSSLLANSSRSLHGGEHAVRVSDWVIVEKTNSDFPECPGGFSACGGKHAVLVEVLLWRD